MHLLKSSQQNVKWSANRRSWRNQPWCVERWRVGFDCMKSHPRSIVSGRWIVWYSFSRIVESVYHLSLPCRCHYSNQHRRVNFYLRINARLFAEWRGFSEHDKQCLCILAFKPLFHFCKDCWISINLFPLLMLRRRLLTGSCSYWGWRSKRLPAVIFLLLFYLQSLLQFWVWRLNGRSEVLLKQRAACWSVIRATLASVYTSTVKHSAWLSTNGA